MLNIVKEILNDAKIAYKESIKINNDILEEHLLSIIGNAKLILNKNSIGATLNNTPQKTTVQESVEVKKVKRRVPKWVNDSSQTNSKILNAFMLLSNNNKTQISTSLLERESQIENNKFQSNFNQMKTISERNHAKVFSEAHGQIELWEPVAEFITQLYHKTQGVFGDEK
ncbi:MAG: hypothetical protein ACXWB0_02855 [Sulfuricurvum sp.]